MPIIAARDVVLSELGGGRLGLLLMSDAF